MDIITTKEICRRLGVSRQSLSKWKAEGCPSEGYGKWDIDAVVKWRKRNKSSAQQGDDPPEETKGLQQQKLEADIAYRRAKAEREKLLLAELRGEFLRKEEVYQEWALRITEITSGLEKLVRSLAPRLVDRTEREIRGILEDEFRVLRDHYARGKAYTPVVSEGESGVEASG
jgi:phage terminase Nu1 subunit (DNA packaging protein)